jgi:hypothetical protein
LQNLPPGMHTNDTKDIFFFIRSAFHWLLSFSLSLWQMNVDIVIWNTCTLNFCHLENNQTETFSFLFHLEGISIISF